MGAFLVYLQAAPAVHGLAPMWELAKGVMLALVTMGVGYLIKTVRLLEFDMQDVRLTLNGKGGKNGLRGESSLHNDRLDELEAWRIRLDTASAIERELYQGEERRHTARRLRDRMLEDETKLKGE